jgi:hypothetical protein
MFLFSSFFGSVSLSGQTCFVVLVKLVSSCFSFFSSSSRQSLCLVGQSVYLFCQNSLPQAEHPQTDGQDSEFFPVWALKILPNV